MIDGHETFSQEVIKKGNKTLSITDDLGRVIVIRKPKFSHYLDLLKALGPELSKNSAYIEAVGIISAIVSIDGQPLPLKFSGDIDHAVRTLEQSDDALALIASSVAENFTDFKSLEEFKDSVKK